MTRVGRLARPGRGACADKALHRGVRGAGSGRRLRPARLFSPYESACGDRPAGALAALCREACYCRDPRGGPSHLFGCRPWICNECRSSKLGRPRTSGGGGGGASWRSGGACCRSTSPPVAVTSPLRSLRQAPAWLLAERPSEFHLTIHRRRRPPLIEASLPCRVLGYGCPARSFAPLATGPRRDAPPACPRFRLCPATYPCP